MSEKKPGLPPKPPDVPRKLSFHRRQLIGIPLMLLIPILALAGLFGESQDLVKTSDPNIKMQVEYPSRFRYKMLGTVTVSITNTSTATISSLEVHFDQSYVKGFSTADFTPEVNTITDQAYVVVLEDVQPGDTRLISLDIQAEKYGMNSGAIVAHPENAADVRAEIKSFVYP